MFIVIGIVTFFIVAIGSVVLMIIAALEANKGVYYRYPVNIRFIR